MDNLVSFHTASFKGTCGCWVIWNGKDVWGKSLRYRAILHFSWVKYPSSSSSLLQSRRVAFIYFRRIGLFQERKAGADLKWKAYDSLCLNVTLSRQNCQKVILLKLGFFNIYPPALYKSVPDAGQLPLWWPGKPNWFPFLVQYFFSNSGRKRVTLHAFIDWYFLFFCDSREM